MLSRRLYSLVTAIVAAGWCASMVPAARAATLSLGPRGIQVLLNEQLFNRHGRWYLLDDGGVCYAYLDSPHTRLHDGRLVLNAHLTSRLGQRIGDACAGADLASDVVLSGKLRGNDRRLVLDDIRIDSVADEATRNALILALQVAPQSLPRQASIDVVELLQRQVVALQGLPLRLEQFRVLDVATRPDAIVIQFDLSASTP